ncbi:MAG: apolipoprotein N-acyltransferase [Planctomycetota bacterium]|jgi:apolipoprotein N-acyltransferase
MRIPLFVWYLAILIGSLVFATLPGHPPHGYGYAWFLLPVLHWIYQPERRRRIELYSAAILLVLLAYPDPDFGFLGWVMLWPYLAARERDDGARWFRAAWWFGFLRALAGYYWLGNIHATAWYFVAVMSGLVFALVFEGALRKLKFMPFALRGATGWLVYEWLHSWLFGGFPWLFAAHTQYEYVWLVQVADLVGVPGLSFLVVFASIAAFRAVQRRKADLELVVAGGLVVLVAVYGAARMVRVPRADGPGVLMVQTSLSFSVKRSGQYTARELIENLEALTAEGLKAHPDTALVVWPETMHPYPLVETIGRPRLYSHMRSLAHRYRRPFVLGINSYTDMDKVHARRGHNSVILCDKDGKPGPLYRKQRLVPMGEEFLLRKFLPDETCDDIKRWLEDNLGYPRSSDLERGEEFVTLDAGPGLKCAMLICFEGLYAQDARAAMRVGDPDLILHLSNNGWFETSWEQRQSVASWVFRAVETRTPFFSCANGGISCAVGPDGRMRAYLDKVMEDGFTYARVPPRWAPPPYLKGGYIALPLGLALLWLLGGIQALRRRPKKNG